MKKSGGFSEKNEVKYGRHDIRFTRSKDGKSIYAIVLVWPQEYIVVQSMNVARAGSIELLGSDDEIVHHIANAGRLVVTPPATQPCKHAFAFKLTGFDFALSPADAPTSNLDDELR